MQLSILLVTICALFPLLNAQFALYTLSLSTTNYVNVFSGNATGWLTYVNQVATGDNGAPAGGPGIQSEHGVFVRDNYLFAVNPTGNSVSIFSINPTSPTQITLINTVNSGGTWPNSVAAYNGLAAVVNSGDVNGLRVFTYSSSGLSVVSGSDRFFNLSLTDPPVSHTGPAQISFTPDGSGLVVSNKGANPPLYYFSISGSGIPAATPVTSSPLGMVSFGFAFDTDGSVVLTDAAPTGTNGGLILAQPSSTAINYLTLSYFLIPNQNAACWVSRSPTVGHFYVGNAASNNITELQRSGSSFTVINNYPVSGGATENIVATIGGVDYLFQIIGAPGGQQIGVYSLSASGATLVQDIATQNSAYGGSVAVYVSTTPAATTTGTPSTTTATSSSTKTESVLYLAIVVVLVLLSLFD